MVETTTRRRETVATLVRVLVVFEALSLFLGAVAHQGVRIPLGFAAIEEPQIIPATIVEGLCGLVLLVSAYGLFTRKPWAWSATVAAQAVALAGVLLGTVAIAVGAGPSTELNDIYHRVMLVLLAGGLALLSTPLGKAALGRGKEGR